MMILPLVELKFVVTTLQRTKQTSILSMTDSFKCDKRIYSLIQSYHKYLLSSSCVSGPRLGSEVNNHFLVMDGAKGHLGWSEDSSKEGTL